MPPGLSPRFPPPKPPKKAPEPRMTKDRALIILGMSTKQRSRVGKELRMDVVSKRLKEKQKEIHERRLKLKEEVSQSYLISTTILMKNFNRKL